MLSTVFQNFQLAKVVVIVTSEAHCTLYCKSDKGHCD